ncbi:hypothetical protein P5673_003577 [Acropora cervicornis]|uniref:Uncharacterized protein n=1 Tax=Acropora cervicornis TaxID=6130 RepID=A0AAD9VE20_ACRCE|nr:hypothetical protein P5673_003577 [Acropora cervicornis]
MEISSFEIRPLKTQDNLKMQDSSKIVDQEPRSRPCLSSPARYFQAGRRKEVEGEDSAITPPWFQDSFKSAF